MPLMNRVELIAVGLALSLSAGIATAEVVAVVSAQSSVNTLSKDQIVGIFLGKTGRFPGGSQAVPIDQAEGSAARNAFYAQYAGKSPAQLKAHWSKIIFTGRGQPPREVANSIDVKKLVVESTNVIGYIEQNLVDDSVKALRSE